MSPKNQKNTQSLQNTSISIQKNSDLEQLNELDKRKIQAIFYSTNRWVASYTDVQSDVLQKALQTQAWREYLSSFATPAVVKELDVVFKEYWWYESILKTLWTVSWFTWWVVLLLALWILWDFGADEIRKFYVWSGANFFASVVAFASTKWLQWPLLEQIKRLAHHNDVENT